MIALNNFSVVFCNFLHNHRPPKSQPYLLYVQISREGRIAHLLLVHGLVGRQKSVLDLEIVEAEKYVWRGIRFLLYQPLHRIIC